MALITRVSRLFRADLHALLDRIEEPESLLRQAVREMEEALARDEQRQRLLEHGLSDVAGREKALGQMLARAELDLNTCLEAGEDELARALIRRKLQAARQQSHLVREREGLESSLAILVARLHEQRSQLENMRQKAALLRKDYAGQCRENGGSWPDLSVRDEDVEVAFLQEKRRREHS